MVISLPPVLLSAQAIQMAEWPVEEAESAVKEWMEVHLYDQSLLNASLLHAEPNTPGPELTPFGAVQKGNRLYACGQDQKA